MVEANKEVKRKTDDLRSLSEVGVKSNDTRITLIVGVITVIATIIAAIPGFVTLNRDRPDVYFSQETASILNSTVTDFDRIKGVLKSNGIPDSLSRLTIVNWGNGPANFVRFRAAVPGEVQKITSSPSALDKPAWVDLPLDFGAPTGSSNIAFEIKMLAPTKPIIFQVGFYGNSLTNRLAWEVFFDGRPAILAAEVNARPQSLDRRQIVMPIAVFGFGALITLLTATYVSIRRFLPLLKDLPQAHEFIIRFASYFIRNFMP